MYSILPRNTSRQLLRILSEDVGAPELRDTKNGARRRKSKKRLTDSCKPCTAETACCCCR